MTDTDEHLITIVYKNGPLEGHQRTVDLFVEDFLPGDVVTTVVAYMEYRYLLKVDPLPSGKFLAFYIDDRILTEDDK